MSFRDRLTPGLMIVMMLAIGTIFIGYNITTTQQHSSDMKSLILTGREQAAQRFIVQQEEDRKDNEEVALVKQVLQKQTAKQQLDNERDNAVQDLILQSLNNTKVIVEQQGNLTKDQREKLIVALNENIEVIPILKNQTNEMLNATNQMLDFIKFITQSFDEEYLEDEVRQYGQSNFTESQIPILQEKLDTLLNKTQ